MTYWKVVKTIENKSIYFLCLALSPNQYLRIPTHFAWSYQIYCTHYASFIPCLLSFFFCHRNFCLLVLKWNFISCILQYSSESHWSFWWANWTWPHLITSDVSNLMIWRKHLSKFKICLTPFFNIFIINPIEDSVGMDEVTCDKLVFFSINAVFPQRTEF